MKNVTWTYLGPDGRRSVVDLKHGVKSGNLIMFANNKVLLIDFEVFGDKTYTFFINDELCKVQIHKINGKFGYQFEIDEDVDTPLNRWKKKKRKKAFRLNAIFVAGASLILIGAIFGFYIYKELFKVRDLARNGLVTSVKFTVEDHVYQGKPFNAKAVYHFRKATYDIHMNFRKTSEEVLINSSGLPIRSGDEFYITFSNWHPDNYRLSFDRPTIRQVERYRQHLLQQYFDENPDMDVSRFHCIFNEAFITKGVAGLATLYSIPEGNNTFVLLKSRKTLMGKQECQ